MFQIFLIAVQRRSSRALVLPIVCARTLLDCQIISLEIPLPFQERPSYAALRLKLVVKARVFPLAVAVLLAVRLPLVLHPPVLKPHLHLLLR